MSVMEGETPAGDKFLAVRFNPIGDVEMFKKATIAALAALSLGGAMTATSADAAPWHGGWRGGDHDGWRGDRDGWRGRDHDDRRGAWRGAGYWGYYGGCRAYWRWNAWAGRYVRVERCY